MLVTRQVPLTTAPGAEWHEVPTSEVPVRLGTNPQFGLTADTVTAQRQQYGPNVLTPPKSHGPLVRLLLQFHQPLVYILLAAAVVTAVLGEFVDCGVILGVVLVNAAIGCLQESKALNAIEALGRTMTTEATVLRQGQKVRIPSSEIVPGDILLLQSGDKVSADARLIQSRELQVDESALTGESLPVCKTPEPLPAGTPLADRRNMVYSSTLLTYGAGTAVVVTTGDRTEIGRISHLIATTDVLATPLTRKITQFSQLLIWAILALAAATFLIGVWRGQNAVEMFMAAVALAVAAIPEGLPAALTITLAIGVSRMARRNAIIRKLPAVETLGSTGIICSDKTGTLTQNQMTVKSVFAGGHEYAVTGQGYRPDGTIESSEGSPETAANVALEECLLAGVLANDSWLRHENGVWRVEGDPTEGALLACARKAGLDSTSVEEQWPRLDSIPFESAYQYMATMHAGRHGSARAYLKGSAEAVISRADWELGPDGVTVPIDRDNAMRRASELASRGLRVLAFARAEFPRGKKSLDHTDLAQGVTLLGFQGMLDPPRPEAVRAVHACQTAGIDVKMITGDHAGTAVAIARQIGLRSGGGDPVALTGAELAALDDEALADKAVSTSVFARVTPEQKLRLVTALQARGHVIAMTGDGVNDAPALRRADIGIAMGVAGTAVAQEASDMVLTDDNFASIEAAVEEGRGVFDNLVKFIAWTLPTNGGEALVVLAAVMAGATLPIVPVQLLWINMTTAIFLGLMLAFEPKEPGIMLRPPRDPARPILTVPLRLRILLVSLLLLAGAFGLFNWALGNGASLAQARTVAVNVFVMGELMYLFNCRSLTKSAFSVGLFSNPLLLAGVASMIALQLLFTYAEPMNKIFHSAPIGLAEWGAVMAAATVIYIAVYVEKSLRRRFATSKELAEEL